jgi:hypothetical protein
LNSSGFLFPVEPNWYTGTGARWFGSRYWYKKPWLVRLLYLLGFLTLLMDLATALYKPPRGVVFERHMLA